MSATRSSLLRATRWIGSRRAILPVTARVVCASLVRESGRFFLRELIRPPGIRIYRVREGGARVALRHRANDGATLAEIFHRGDYRPPEEVAAALGTPRSILDLGANIGLFGAFALARWPAATIAGYEADPENAAVHERAISLNNAATRWRLTSAAAGARAREVELASGRAMGSFVISDPVQVPTIHVPLIDVMDEVCAADLVKVDIEGGEWEILLDPRFGERPPRMIVLEYHPHLCPDADPRVAAERALVGAGLRIAPIWHRDDGYGMVWGWRE